MPLKEPYFVLSQGGTKLIFEFITEDVSIEHAFDNDRKSIVGLGEIVRQGLPNLCEFSLEALFWRKITPTDDGSKTTPSEALNQLTEWENQKPKKPLRIVSVGLGIAGTPQFDMTVIINSRKESIKIGEENDRYFNIPFVEYRPYGAVIVEIPKTPATPANNNGNSKTMPAAVPARADNKPPTPKEYMVKGGDCLINITKSLTNGKGNWRDLYELNKGVIGSNPNLIYPGQTLIIPETW